MLSAVADRDTLLDAAREQLRRCPWSEIKMADIAHGADTSRATLYKMFGSRRELGRALVARESARVLEEIEVTLDACPDDPARALLDAFDAFLRAADESPLIGSLLRGDAPELLARPVIEDIALMNRAARRAAQMIACAWPLTEHDDAALLGEVLVRLAASHATRRGTHEDGCSPAAPLAPFIERVVPAVDAGAGIGDREGVQRPGGAPGGTLATTVA